MKKILFVTDAWAPQRNGVTTVLNELTTRLLTRGYEVKVIHPELCHTVPLPIYPEIHLALFPRRRMAREIEAFAPDAIYLMTEGPLGWAARAYCKRKGIPFTSWYHTHFQLYAHVRIGPLLWPILALVRRFHSAATTTIVTTNSLKMEIESVGYKNVEVVPLGVDTDLFVRNESLTGDQLQRPVFVYFGRLAIEKSPEDFLKLKLPGTKLVIGGGPLFEPLKQKYPQVRFLGPYDAKTQAFVDQLSQCDVFVFPSRTETFGQVVLEALACGVPVAAYDVMGPRDIIESGVDGHIGHNLEESALACLTLSREACRATALRYSWEHSVDAFIASLASAAR